MADHSLQTAPASGATPLCVSLDGGLLRTSAWHETIAALLTKQPLAAGLLVLWLLRGRAYAKREVRKRIALDASTLPYSATFLSYLTAQKSAGVPLVLLSGDNAPLARDVAAHLGLFDCVIEGGDGRSSSVGKLTRELERRFGHAQFDYIGAPCSGESLFKASRRAVAVGGKGRSRLLKRLQGKPIEPIEEARTVRIAGYLAAMRPHQWLKNLLVLLPVAASHRGGEPAILSSALLAFLAFSFCASTAYIVNDLLDLAADRKHSRKKERPFASGVVPVQDGVWLAAALLAIAALITLSLPPLFVAVLALYFILTVAYSTWLKRKLVLDVLTLSALYTLRVLAGAAATDIRPSFWLLAFSVFLFSSLAFVKRYVEIAAMMQKDSRALRRRAYRHEDLHTLQSLGCASGYLAVLVLALYVHSPEVQLLYSCPEALWLICPLLLYWVSRIWILAARQRVHDDPLVYAIRDKPSRITLALTVLIVLAANVLPALDR